MFESKYEERGPVDLPDFSGIRVMMMPLILGMGDSIPPMLDRWRGTLAKLFDFCPQHKGQVGYLTIDEKHVKASTTHRREGLHVDGVLNGRAGGWGGGGGGGWGASGTGMLTVSNPAGCRAWRGTFDGWPGNDGECDHLRDQLGDGELFKPNTCYWVDGLCVHESVPMEKDVDRTFCRLSMPSTAPWFEGYTENPLGVKPTGEILPRRKYM